MILGNVNANREAIVQLVVLSENNQKQGIRAVIDTGYTGCLNIACNGTQSYARANA
jgi:predicted aspartyl protease